MDKEQLQNILAVLEMAYYGTKSGNTITSLKKLKRKLNVQELKRQIITLTDWLHSDTYRKFQ